MFPFHNLGLFSKLKRFGSACSVNELLNVYSSVDVIHSVRMPVDSTAKCSFIVSLGSAGLISSTNGVWLSKKLNSAYRVSLNLNLTNRFIAVYGGGYLVLTE